MAEQRERGRWPRVLWTGQPAWGHLSTDDSAGARGEHGYSGGSPNIIPLTLIRPYE